MKIIITLSITSFLLFSGCSAIEEANKIGEDIQTSVNNVADEYQKVKKQIEDTQAEIEQTSKEIQEAQKEIEDGINKVSDTINSL